MSYIQDSLGDGETIIARARFPWFYAATAWAALLLPLVVTLGYCVYLGQRPTPFAANDPASWGLLPLGIWLLLGFIAFARIMIRIRTVEIGVTSHRFVEKYGLLSMRTNEIALPQIEGVRVNQSVFGRMLGFGVVRIEGTGVDAVTTPKIADPVGFVRAIQTAKEHQAGAR